MREKNCPASHSSGRPSESDYCPRPTPRVPAAWESREIWRNVETIASFDEHAIQPSTRRSMISSLCFFFLFFFFFPRTSRSCGEPASASAPAPRVGFRLFIATFNAIFPRLEVFRGARDATETRNNFSNGTPSG